MNAQELLSKLLSGPLSGAAGGMVGGGLVAALGHKSGRRLLGKAAQLGGVAALGALAWNAWQKHQQAQAAASGTPLPAPAPASLSAAPLPPAFTPAGDAGERFSLAVIEAMISAARADGSLDGAELGRLQARMDALGLTPDEKAHCLNGLSAASDPARIARLASNAPEAAELYLASLLAIEPEHWAEQAYLEALRAALGISPALASELAASARGATAPGAPAA